MDQNRPTLWPLRKICPFLAARMRRNRGVAVSLHLKVALYQAGRPFPTTRPSPLGGPHGRRAHLALAERFSSSRWRFMFSSVFASTSPQIRSFSRFFPRFS